MHWAWRCVRLVATAWLGPPAGPRSGPEGILFTPVTVVRRAPCGALRVMCNWPVYAYVWERGGRDDEGVMVEGHRQLPICGGRWGLSSVLADTPNPPTPAYIPTHPPPCTPGLRGVGRSYVPSVDPEEAAPAPPPVALPPASPTRGRRHTTGDPSHGDRGRGASRSSASSGSTSGASSASSGSGRRGGRRHGKKKHHHRKDKKRGKSGKDRGSRGHKRARGREGEGDDGGVAAPPAAPADGLFIEDREGDPENIRCAKGW